MHSFTYNFYILAVFVWHKY